MVEKLASSLVDARLNKKADLFLRNTLKVFPNNTHLNSLMGYNLLSLNCHKEGLGFLKKGFFYFLDQLQKLRIMKKDLNY